MAIILGIDPGTRIMGYGIIQSHNGEIRPVAYGSFHPRAALPMAERLAQLYAEVNRTIETYHPDAVAVEQPFVARNIASALAIGKAQAVAILAAATHHLPVYEYTPSQIKQRIASYGASSKEQVQAMVQLQLGLSEIPQNDAADALAVAVCHIQEMHLKDLLEGTADK